MAHEVLEAILLTELGIPINDEQRLVLRQGTNDMIRLGGAAARFILDLHKKTPDSEVLVETRIYLDFIHPEMFGTFDGAVVDYFGTLHVFDYKYGAGVPVSVRENLQMIFYGIGLAHRYQWNFKKVRLWIIQPRIKGYDGPTFWDVPILRLKVWVDTFRAAVKNVEENPETYVEGPWCHWCKVKSICPLKTERKLEEAKSVFTINPVRRT